MGSIKTSTGLASGIDTATLIKALLTNNQSAVTKIQNRQKAIQASQTGLSTVQAGLLSLASSAQTLSSKSTFQALQLQNSDPGQLSVTTTTAAVAGIQQFQAVRLASTDQSLSRGYADASQQLGLSGQIVIGRGGGLNRPTSLDLLNDGAGVRRGTIRITDRSGASATVDLTETLTVDDVVRAINNQSAVSVRASTQDGKIILEDKTGLTTANLSVVDTGGGHAAADLGIAGSVAAATLAGSNVFEVSSDVLLTSVNDGNGVRLNPGTTAELAIMLRDGATLNVDLDGAKTVGDVVQKINSATSNDGKLTAALVDGRLRLTDTTGGAGALSVGSTAGSNAAQALGLDNAASGDVLTGKRLSGGLNSVLLRNLRGGQGITTPGEISLTDRTGATAVVDLAQAESLDEVLTAINNATSAGNVKLQLRAALDSRGTGIVITDTSGQTASNLIVADVGGGSVAGDLNIAVDAAATSVSSGSLALRSVNEATSLAKYSPGGGTISLGSFSITNSAGDSAVVTISSSIRTVGDVIDKINTAGINVTAQLNETGDGFVLVDNAAGAGALKVQEIGGSAGADLRLLGAATTGLDGKQRVSSRSAQVIQVATDDTLTTLSTKINSAGGLARSSVIDSGAAINPFRLSLTSTASGAANQLIIDDGGLGFNFSKVATGLDAVLRIGSDPATGFLKTSNTNQFSHAVTGYNVTLLNPGDQAAVVTGSLNSLTIAEALSSFAKSYNQLASQIDTLTSYDAATGARGVLQGEGAVQQVESRITSLVNRVFGAANAPIRSMADLGLTVAAGGQLAFDSAKFAETMAAHPQDVTKIFTDAATGFGTKLNAVLKDLNDPDTGSLTAKVKADEDHVHALQDQIERMNSTLASRQAYLELQFSNMETVLSGLQSQQDALTALANIATSLANSNNN